MLDNQVSIKKVRIERPIPLFLKIIFIIEMLFFFICILLQMYEVVARKYETMRIWKIWTVAAVLLFVTLIYTIVFLISSEYHIKNNFAFLTKLILLASFLFQLSGALFGIAANAWNRDGGSHLDFYGNYSFWSLTLIFISFPLMLFSIAIQSKANQRQSKAQNALLLTLEENDKQHVEEYRKIYDILNNVGNMKIISKTNIDAGKGNALSALPDLKIIENSPNVKDTDEKIIKKEEIKKASTSKNNIVLKKKIEANNTSETVKITTPKTPSKKPVVLKSKKPQ